MRQRLAPALLSALSALSTPVSARTHQVALGESLAQALLQAADGDTVVLQAGEHRGQVGVITQQRLTLRGSGPGVRTVLLADGQHAEGKALLVVRGGQVLVEDIEFRGARVPDRNGAGIRFERGQLTVRRCRFIDNQNGILAGNDGQGELQVLDSLFAQAPAGTRLPHLIYVGQMARFVLQGSQVSGGRQGHLVKSRARVNQIRYNHIVDGDGGHAAYELEFPNGGQAEVVGNVIGQSADSSNPVIVSFGAEGEALPAQPRTHALVLLHNTLINTGLRPAIFVRVHEERLKAAVQQRFLNNLFVGLGVADMPWGEMGQGNALAAPTQLQDIASGRFALKADAWLRGRGVVPDALGDDPVRALWPQAEFAWVGASNMPGIEPLAPRQRWSSGAHQEVAHASPALTAAPVQSSVPAPVALSASSPP